MMQDRLAYELLASSDGSWQLLAPETEELLARTGVEPWPEVSDRPWPDGARQRPLLWRLLGWGLPIRPERWAVRAADTGTAWLWLHPRTPVFEQTFGLFDAADQRIGYLSRGFKRAGGDRIEFRDASHRPIGRSEPAGSGEYVFRAGDQTLGHLLRPSGAGRFLLRRTESEPSNATPLFLLAAALLLAQQSGG